jgi:hypothetical protein
MIADIEANGWAIVVIAQLSILNRRRRTYENQVERQGWGEFEPHPDAGARGEEEPARQDQHQGWSQKKYKSIKLAY